MYYIRKYADCWAIHDDDTVKSRPLTNEETEAVKVEFPELADEKTRSGIGKLIAYVLIIFGIQVPTNYHNPLFFYVPSIVKFKSNKIYHF